jgi:putative restriction endonuclease
VRQPAPRSDQRPEKRAVSELPPLGPLHRKAAIDAGFDLDPEADVAWWRLRSAGVGPAAWVRPGASGAGAWVALPRASQLAELSAPASEADAALPGGAAGAVWVANDGELRSALRRARTLLAQMPPAPRARLAERLAAIDGTTREALVRQRVGQSVFRDALLDYWEGRCAVTGLAVPQLLRASHAKPWAESTDDERLDVHNGLLLAVHLDALFDAGLISFTDEGHPLVSPALTAEALAALGLAHGIPPLSRVAEGHRPYLEHHRAFVYRAEG